MIIEQSLQDFALVHLRICQRRGADPAMRLRIEGPLLADGVEERLETVRNRFLRVALISVFLISGAVMLMVGGVRLIRS